MTDKELLYVKDALEHEEFLKTMSQEAAAKLKDPELSNFMQQMQTKHCDNFNKICNLLGN